MYIYDRGDILELIKLSMDNETRTFITKEFDKLTGSMTQGFEVVGHRLGNIESRLGNVEGRLDGVEFRLGNVELRLGSLEMKVSELSDTLEQEMIFTSDFRDEFAGRIRTLETKAGV